MGLLSKNLYLFRVSGIRVQLSAVFVLFAVVMLIQGAKYPGFTIMSLVVLWGSVLLHEFGHCAGARQQGGDASQIVLGPLGGLASVEAPEVPWSQLVVAVSGPAVNVVLCLATLPLVYAIHPLAGLALDSTVGFTPYEVVHATFSTNLGLLLFNAIPAFPMDGGRVLQCLLWWRTGYRKATRIACYVSFVCATGMVIYALAHPPAAGRPSSLIGENILVFIGIWVFVQALGTLKAVEAGAYDELDEPWRRTYWYRDPERRKPGFFARFLARRREARARAAEVADVDRSARLDEILRRVSEVGMDGLSPSERSFLEEESSRLRNNKP